MHTLLRRIMVLDTDLQERLLSLASHELLNPAAAPRAAHVKGVTEERKWEWNTACHPRLRGQLPSGEEIFRLRRRTSE
jgi:hypothetical protein